MMIRSRARHSTSFAALQSEKASPARSAWLSPPRSANGDGRHDPLWRSWEIGIGVDEPLRSRGYRFAARRGRTLPVVVALLSGIAVGGLGQHVVASHDMDAAMVELAETMIAGLRSLGGDGVP